MQALIDERCRDFSAQLRARSLLDSFLCLEMARASVKIDVAHELLIINQERVLGRVESQWDEDAAAREDRRAEGSPGRTVRRGPGAGTQQTWYIAIDISMGSTGRSRGRESAA